MGFMIFMASETEFFGRSRPGCGSMPGPRGMSCQLPMESQWKVEVT